MTKPGGLLFTLLLTTVCLRPALADWHERTEEKMGTTVRVSFLLEDPDEAVLLMTQAMAEFDRIEALMSTRVGSSEVSRLNASAAQTPQKVSEELFALLDVAGQLSAISEGAFDLTYASVGQLYDYDEGVHPDSLDIAAKLEQVDYRHVVLNDDELTVAFAVPGVRINLDGIVSGFAVEQVSKILRDEGIRHAQVSAGNDMRLTGNREGRGWLVDIRDPDDAERVFTRFELVEEAVSTSGDYERFFVEDGRRYHHILNPATGKPVETVRSVTVVGPDATVTDGLSTAVFVLGAEAGMDMIAGMDGYEALIILADGTWYYSGGLSPAPEDLK